MACGDERLERGYRCVYVRTARQTNKERKLKRTGQKTETTATENSGSGRLRGRRHDVGRKELALYRHRWQVELAFKRMKSLLGVSHLRKKPSEGAKTWLQGKLLVVCLIERLIAVGEHFPLSRARPKNEVVQLRCRWREMALIYWLLCCVINPRLS